MPCNLYGPGDYFHPERSHVIPALMQRFHDAARDGAEVVTCWGSGTPRREFMHVDDVAEACGFLLQAYSGEGHLNVGTGSDITIREPRPTRRPRHRLSPAASSGTPASPTAPCSSAWTSRASARWAGARASASAQGLEATYRWFLEQPALRTLSERAQCASPSSASATTPRPGRAASCSTCSNATRTVDTFFAEADVAAVRRAAPASTRRATTPSSILQLHEAFALLSGRHPNVTFAPMYDAMWRGGAFSWKPSFNAAKILCFSWALRAEVMRRGAVHALVQYFPDPAGRPPRSPDFDTLHGFLWYRRRDIPPETVFALTRARPSPPSPSTTRPTRAMTCLPGRRRRPCRPAAAQHLVGGWRRLRDSARRAPTSSSRRARWRASAWPSSKPWRRGLCVVARDAPTMNEYISHGRNGLLYAPDRVAPLDFTTARDLGAQARDSMRRGRARWDAGLPALLDFLADAPPRTDRRRAAPTDRRAPRPRPPTAGDPLRRREASATTPRGSAAPSPRRPADRAMIRGHHLAPRPAAARRCSASPSSRPPGPGCSRARSGPTGPRGLGVAGSHADPSRRAAPPWRRAAAERRSSSPRCCCAAGAAGAVSPEVDASSPAATCRRIGRAQRARLVPACAGGRGRRRAPPRSVLAALRRQRRGAQEAQRRAAPPARAGLRPGRLAATGSPRRSAARRRNR